MVVNAPRGWRRVDIKKAPLKSGAEAEEDEIVDLEEQSRSIRLSQHYPGGVFAWR